MSIRKLTLIAAAALALALTQSALAQEQDGEHEGHHPGAADAASASGEAADHEMDEGKGLAAAERPAAPGMMMCQPMMAMMMGKGSMMPKMGMMGQGGMGEGGMDGRMKGKSMSGMSMMGPDGGAMAHAGFSKLIAVDAIKVNLEKAIADNKRLKVGKFEPGGDFSMSAEIVTIDGSLVHKLLIDRRDGSTYEVD